MPRSQLMSKTLSPSASSAFHSGVAIVASKAARSLHQPQE